MTYSDLVKNFLENPRDVKSVPIRKTSGVWFYTYVENGIVYVTKAKDHKPSSNISIPRKIDPKHFDEMVILYQRRCCGEPVSEEAKAVTVCQIYWYGILAELGI